MHLVSSTQNIRSALANAAGWPISGPIITQASLAALALASVLALGACTQPPPPADLASHLRGMSKAQFITCAGPPTLSTANGNQEQSYFEANLKRGSAIGINPPGAGPMASCSVNTVFQDDKVISATLGGNVSMCDLVFAPCIH